MTDFGPATTSPRNANLNQAPTAPADVGKIKHETTTNSLNTNSSSGPATSAASKPVYNLKKHWLQRHTGQYFFYFFGFPKPFN